MSGPISHQVLLAVWRTLFKDNFCARLYQLKLFWHPHGDFWLYFIFNRKQHFAFTTSLFHFWILLRGDFFFLHFIVFFLYTMTYGTEWNPTLYLSRKCSLFYQTGDYPAKITSTASFNMMWGFLMQVNIAIKCSIKVWLHIFRRSPLSFCLKKGCVIIPPHLILNQLCGLLLTLHFTYFTGSCRSRSAASGGGGGWFRAALGTHARGKGKSINIKKKSSLFRSICQELKMIIAEARWAFPVLVRVKEFKRSRKCKVWCWDVKWAAVTTWPFHSISIHFPHLEHFPENCASQKVFFFSWLTKVLFLSENMTVSSDMLAGDKSSPHSHHQPHLISAKHCSAEKWLTLRCLWSWEGGWTWGRNLAILSRVSRSPGWYCLYFSVGRLIIHEYFMIACLRLDRAAGLMENINVVEGKCEWGAP